MRFITRFKGVDLKQKRFHCFNYRSDWWYLYDRMLRNPLKQASLNEMNLFISRLPNDIEVIYYKQDKLKGYVPDLKKRPKKNNDLEIENINNMDLNEWIGFDESRLVFYYFDLKDSSNLVALFDDEMGHPILKSSNIKGYDKKYKVDIFVTKHIPVNAVIYYFQYIGGIFTFKVRYVKKENKKQVV